MESMTPQGSTNAERLTWDQICSRFPDEWVVLVETDWVNDRDFEFGTASPHIKAAFDHYPQIGCFWTGEIRGPIPRFIAA
jgi:hypothetical protein